MSQENSAVQSLKILVAGASGQLSKSLQEVASRFSDIDLSVAGRPELNLLEPETIAVCIERYAPEIIINAAAYTAVDKAETEPELAFAVNRDGARIIAELASERNIPIAHLSTDYVFDGSKNTPYQETDHPAPMTVYGRSKLEGEAAVASANTRHLIFRTAWVYSPYANNFVKTILRLAKERSGLRVVADQHGSPTYAPDLAIAILTIIRRFGQKENPWGIYHLAGNGTASWYEFAKHIVNCSARLGNEPVLVQPVATEDYPTPAHRPANSRLDCSRVEAVFGISMPDWRRSVAECVECLCNGRNEMFSSTQIVKFSAR